MLTEKGLWVINRATDIEGKPKELPEKRVSRTYEIVQLIEGYPAILVDNESQGTLITSNVNDFDITDNTLILHTLNSVYYFEKI